MPRDHYKTSIAQALVAHIIIQPQDNNVYWPGVDGSNLRILYAAETDETAKKRIGLIQRHFESNELFYSVKIKTGIEFRPSLGYHDEEVDIFDTYIFPVPITETKGATFKAQDRAIYFMRFINAALKDGTFRKV